MIILKLIMKPHSGKNLIKVNKSSFLIRGVEPEKTVSIKVIRLQMYRQREFQV